MVTKKRKVQFNIALIIFPLLILAVLEISLRFMGYGDKTKLFFKPRYVPELYLENVEGYNKYQDKKNEVKSDKIENQIRNMMQSNKKPECLRGFVVGESAAQGFPYNSNCSFSKMMEAALQKTGRYSEVEVLNMGASAISTYSVKDISKKVLAYNPDFLVVYAGNNEYYGTFSYITGGSHFTRNLYMQLYELRIFQLMKGFVSLFSAEKKDQVDNLNIMKERFSEKVIPKDEKIDQLVALNYVKNIESIVQLFTKNDIPVIVVEPACNIIDLPPFKGDKDEEIRTSLVGINKLFNSGNIQLADSALKLLKKSYPVNANVVYLEAKIDRVLSNDINLEKFEEAKNMDIVPFRPREELLKYLKEFCTANKDKYDQLIYVPLKEKLFNLYGDSIFGNSIFADHVHYNQLGHKILGEIITQELANALHFAQNENDSINAFFSDEEAVFKAVYSLPMYRLFANKLVSSLLEQPPFNDMVFSFQPDPKELSNAINDLGIDLAEKTLPLDYNNSFVQTVSYYMEKQNFDMANQYFMGERFMFPGSYHRYLNLGRFFRRFENHNEEAELAYTQAYLLSEKKKDIYKEVIGFFNESGQFAKVKEFEKKHGKPRN